MCTWTTVASSVDSISFRHKEYQQTQTCKHLGGGDRALGVCPGVVWRLYIVLSLALRDAPVPISVAVALVLTLTNSG